MGEMHIGQRTRHIHVIRAIKKLNPDGKLILDAGCGKGDYAFFIAKNYPLSNIEGIEVNKTIYHNCKKRGFLMGLPNVFFIQQDLCEPFANSRYDLIYSVDVLEHINDDNEVLRNMFVALRSGGQLILHVPLVEKHLFRKIREMPRQPDHVRHGYEEKDLLEKIIHNGFVIIEKKYTFSRYRGALAWEIWRLCSEMNLLFQLIIHPLLVLLSWSDGVTVNKSGGGILTLAQKPMDN